ncbi:LysM domain protein [Gammaproteobacteria bacterium]
MLSIVGRIGILLGIAFLSTVLVAETSDPSLREQVPALAPKSNPALNPRHPEYYVVVPRDTLWDVAARFLVHPWRWKDLWRNNPSIKNPHLIYPGDKIILRRVKGELIADLVRGPGGREAITIQEELLGSDLSTVHLSPKIRVLPLNQAIPTIPLGTIQPFLSQTRITAVGEMEAAAYVVGQADRRLAAAAGDAVYVRGINTDNDTTRYTLYRPGRPYHRQDPKGGEPELLGIEAIPIGEGEIERTGELATLRITRSVREVLAGDRVFPENDQIFNQNFMPRAPEVPMEGHIIDVLGGVSRIGQLQTVVLDLGHESSLEIGHVLVIYQSGDQVIDPLTKEVLILPQEQAGLLMVFRVFNRLSYALVLEAQKEIRLQDTVRPPEP